VEHYRNGDSIPTGRSDSAWAAATSGAFIEYDGDPANTATYGLLYKWYAVSDLRGLCPSGWHVPRDGEWTAMVEYLGGQAVAGGKLKTTGTLSAGTGLWQDPNMAGTNSSGFSGLPGGSRDYLGNFYGLGTNGYWWTSSELFSNNAWNWALFFYDGYAYRSFNNEQIGFSVRCLQD